MADLDGIRDGLEKDRMTAVVPPRPKDLRIINDLLAEVERLRDGIRQHRDDHPLKGLWVHHTDRSLWALLDDRTETT